MLAFLTHFLYVLNQFFLSVSDLHFLFFVWAFFCSFVFFLVCCFCFGWLVDIFLLLFLVMGFFVVVVVVAWVCFFFPGCILLRIRVGYTALVQHLQMMAWTPHSEFLHSTGVVKHF